MLSSSVKRQQTTSRSSRSRGTIFSRLILTSAMVVSPLVVYAASGLAPVQADACPPGMTLNDKIWSQVFSYTGAPQTFTVPKGIKTLKLDVLGAGGGSGFGKGPDGGRGGEETATVPVTAGTSLSVIVGQWGGQGTYNPGISAAPGPGGYGGGGNGASDSGGGGGGSFVFGPGPKLLIAAGGGGANATDSAGGNGGNGGGTAGGTAGTGAATQSYPVETPPATGGGGATGSGGTAGKYGVMTTPKCGQDGASGKAGSGEASGPASFGTGGTGAAVLDESTPCELAGAGAGGGGGGGYFGGGGGGSGYYGGGGGGGGSGYVVAGATGAVSGTSPYAAGNGQVTISLPLQDPAVKDVVPDDGSAKGGQTIDVSGKNFTHATDVTFELPDGAEVPARSFSCASDRCRVVTPNVSKDVTAANHNVQPNNGTGDGQLPTNVRVTTGAGTSVVVTADQFTFSLLTVTGVSPNQGPLDQTGSSSPNIIVTGTGFKDGKTIITSISPRPMGAATLNVSPSSITWDSSTRLTLHLGHNVALDLPDHSESGSYPTNVIAWVGKDTSPVNPKDVYTFKPPEITSISPDEVPLDLVKPVTIRGTNFEGVTDVIGICGPNGSLDVPSHPFDKLQSNGSSAITTTTSKFMDIRLASDRCEHGGPAEATYPFDVRMAVGHVYSQSVRAGQFTYEGPVIKSVTSTEKPYLDAQVPITITGTGLDKVNEITVRNPVTGDNSSHQGPDEFLMHTSNEIVFPAPDDVSTILPDAGGPFTQIRYPVEVHILVGYALDPGTAVNFEFLGPQVTGVSPSSGPLKGGKPITIKGNGFQRATRVGFRLSTNPAKAEYLDKSQFKVSADGKIVTITKGPDLISLVPAHATAPVIFDASVDVNNAENPPTAASHYKGF